MPRAEESGRAAAALFYFGVLLVAAAVALVWETAARQPSAYLDPGGGPPTWAATLAAGMGAAFGLWLGARPQKSRPRERLPWLMLATSLVAR